MRDPCKPATTHAASTGPAADARLPAQQTDDRLDLIARAVEAQNGALRCAIVVHELQTDRLRVAAAPSLAPALAQAIGALAPLTTTPASQPAPPLPWPALRRLAAEHRLPLHWMIEAGTSNPQQPAYLLVFAAGPAPGEAAWRAAGDAVALCDALLARDRARERDASIALAVDGSQTGIWDRNVATGRIHYSNDWLAMLGYAPGEVSQRIEDAFARIHPDDLSMTKQAIDDHFAGRTPIYAVEHRLRCKDHSYKWISSRGKVVERDAAGAPLRMTGISTDITHLMHLSDSLRQYVANLTSLTNDVPALIFQCYQAPDGRAFFPYASAGIEQIFELTADQVAASVAQVEARVHPDDLAAFRASQAQCAANLSHWHHEFRVILPRQGECWRQADAQPHRINNGGILWHGMISDINERKSIAVRLHDLTATDFLTGLLNRSAFLERMKQEHRCLNDNCRMETSLLLFDLDHFRRVNSTYGHAMGDLVLQHFSAILRVERRRVDAAGRLGGEQFALLLVGACISEARMLAQRVRQRLLKAPLTEGEIVVPITVSVGIASLLADDDSVHRALARADRALYLAKELGRDRIQVASDE